MTAAEGIARAETNKVALDRAFDNAMGSFRTMNTRGGSLTGVGGVIAMSGVLVPAFGIAAWQAGFRATALYFLVPVVGGSLMGFLTGGLPSLYNSGAGAYATMPDNLRFYREQIEQVFFRAFTQMLNADATFATARAATIQAARDLYGANSAAERAVTDAWTAVGVN